MKLPIKRDMIYEVQTHTDFKTNVKTPFSYQLMAQVGQALQISWMGGMMMTDQ